MRNGYHTLRGYNAQYEHIAIAEKAFGKPLPPGVVVHHMDGSRTNNERDPVTGFSNLAVFPDEDYHKLIHRRMRAMAATGNPAALLCRRCHQYDGPSNLSIRHIRGRKTTTNYHPQCERDYANARNALKRKGV